MLSTLHTPTRGALIEDLAHPPGRQGGRRLRHVSVGRVARAEQLCRRGMSIRDVAARTGLELEPCRVIALRVHKEGGAS